VHAELPGVTWELLVRRLAWRRRVAHGLRPPLHARARLRRVLEDRDERRHRWCLLRQVAAAVTTGDAQSWLLEQLSHVTGRVDTEQGREVERDAVPHFAVRRLLHRPARLTPQPNGQRQGEIAARGLVQ
jgi:hypothetical protein